MSSLTEPLLDAPAPGWSHDLSEPIASPSMRPYPPAMSNSPNHMDNIYLELHRATSRVRGIGVWLAIMGAPVVAALISGLGTYIALTNNPKLYLMVITLTVIFGASWICIYVWRMDTAAPRDEPIRFNRARRKVYVYRFYHDGRRPLSRTAWFTRAEVYNWDDLRAEACEVYGPMGSGGLIQTVTLAVVKPGTNEVIDRFHFAHGGLEGEMYWALAQLYMQQGPDALPEFEYLPRDWNNEDVTLNLARYLAPKVKWPEDMDLESRTAP